MTTTTAQTLMADVLAGRQKREATVQSDIERLCAALGYDVEREYPIADCRARRPVSPDPPHYH